MSRPSEMPCAAPLRAAAAVLALATGASQAAVIVDTGVPTGSGGAVLQNYSIPNFATFVQSLGGQFTLGAATTVTQIDGWIATDGPVGSNYGGDVTASLWAGAPHVGAQPLFSTTKTLRSSDFAWQAFGGNVAWAIDAGTYTVTFSAGPGYRGSMLTGAPAPLSAYYSYSGSGDWAVSSFSTIGIRVVAVPEPASAALLLAGLATVGGVARVQRRSGQISGR